VRLIRRRPDQCDRARDWISRELDHDLSEIERTLLRRHLGACERCDAFREDVAAITTALRAAPLQALPRPVELPRARRLAFRPLQAAAGLAVAAVGVGSLFGMLQARESGGGVAKPPTISASSEQWRDAKTKLQLEQRRSEFHIALLANQAEHGGPQAV
jgi:ferric-dicitrate binding protein FerR (iron transport regulator)